jgi:hypothetical protein
VIAIMQFFGYNQVFDSRGIVDSVELSNGVQVQTLEETARNNDSRNSLGSYKKDGDSEVSTGRGGFFARWRKVDVDAGDAGTANTDNGNDNA